MRGNKQNELKNSVNANGISFHVTQNLKQTVFSAGARLYAKSFQNAEQCYRSPAIYAALYTYTGPLSSKITSARNTKSL